MTWEEKTEMIKLHNQGEQTACLEFILKHINDDLDEQAKSMIINCIEMTDAAINANFKIHEQLHPILDTWQSDSMKDAIRLSYYDVSFKELKQARENGDVPFH